VTDHKLSAAPIDIVVTDKPAPEIRRIETYRDARGIEIQAHTEVGTKDNPILVGAKTIFLAPVNVPVQTPQGVRPVPIVVPITGVSNIFDAFAVADQQINDKAPNIVQGSIQRMQDEMRRQALTQNLSNMPVPARHGG